MTIEVTKHELQIIRYCLTNQAYHAEHNIPAHDRAEDLRNKQAAERLKSLAIKLGNVVE